MLVTFPSLSVTRKTTLDLYSFCAWGVNENWIVTNKSWCAGISPFLSKTLKIPSFIKSSVNINSHCKLLLCWTLPILISFNWKFFSFSYMKVFGNFTTMSLIVITLSIFSAFICLFNPLYSSFAPINLKFVSKSKLSLSNVFGQKMKSKSNVSPGGIVIINSLKSSAWFSSLDSSLFSLSSTSSSSSSNCSSFFSFSKGLIKWPFSNLSFSGNNNLKSLKRMSLFKFTKTFADNFELFLKVNNLEVGSLKLTPPKSKLSWTI